MIIYDNIQVYGAHVSIFHFNNNIFYFIGLTCKDIFFHFAGYTNTIYEMGFDDNIKTTVHHDAPG